MKYKISLWLLVSSLLVLTKPAQAQSQPARTVQSRQEVLEDRSSLVSRVAYFRRSALGDTTKFALCEAAELVGDIETFKRFLRSNFSSITLFREPATSCSSRTNSDNQSGRVTRLDSIHLEDDAAAVFSSVRQDEHLHREMFRLIRRKGGRGWDVTEMKVYGILRLH